MTDVPTDQDSPPPQTADGDAADGEATVVPPRRPDDDEEPEESVSLVRPYAWTQGRTKSSVHLELETLVSTARKTAGDNAVGLEHQSIAALCRHPHSVAEVAAKLSVPLGVARVLLSDMAEMGLVKVHQTVADDDIAAHLVLMERVLSGLRRL